MIEQIINWWNTLDSSSKATLGIFITAIIFMILMIYGSTVGEYLKNKRKSYTQKYREGLIKK